MKVGRRCSPISARGLAPVGQYYPSSARRLLKNNPFWPAEPTTPRASMLRSEVPRLYSAMAFAMWQYGKVMNGHLTICWKLLGVTDPNKAVQILSETES